MQAALALLLTNRIRQRGQEVPPKVSLGYTGLPRTRRQEALLLALKEQTAVLGQLTNRAMWQGTAGDL